MFPQLIPPKAVSGSWWFLVLAGVSVRLCLQVSLLPTAGSGSSEKGCFVIFGGSGQCGQVTTKVLLRADPCEDQTQHKARKGERN